MRMAARMIRWIGLSCCRISSEYTEDTTNQSRDGI